MSSSTFENRQQSNLGVLELFGKARRNLKNYSFLTGNLVKFNIRSRYRRSFLGMSWLFIVPILSVVIWIMLKGSGVIEPGDTSIPYPAYVLLSTSIWGFFSELYRVSGNLLLGNGRILGLTDFPHEVLVAQSVIEHLIRFVIPFGVNIVVLLAFGVHLGWTALIFPVTLLPLLLLGLSFGLLTTLMRVVISDLANAFDYFIRFLMFVTPVIYSPKIKAGWLSRIVEYNPMTYLIGWSRDTLIGEPVIYGAGLWISIGLSIIIFLFSFIIFQKSEGKIVERLTNN